MGNRWVLIGLTLLLCLFAFDALADTGGSMGGGDWGGGGGGGGYSGGGGSYSGGGGGYSSSSSWSSSGGGGGYSSSNGWSSSDSGSGGGGSISAAGILMFAVIAAVFFFFVLIMENAHKNPTSMGFGSSYSAPIAEADVSVLRIAVDGRARMFVQRELASLAGSADTKTADGRAKLLRDVAMMLRRLRDAWVYGGAINESMTTLRGAKHVFDRHVDDARSRFKEETIRNEQGEITRRQASDYSPRSDEGAGLILISIVLAARRELFTVSRIGDGDDLRRALESASQLTPANLVAIEVIWQPSEDNDRLSSIELEAKYPRPDLIPIQNALVGKTFCTHCAGPFPAELVSCPHCGAPAPGRDVPKAA